MNRLHLLKRLALAGLGFLPWLRVEPMAIALTKLAEGVDYISLGWSPVQNATGYRFSTSLTGKKTHTWDPLIRRDAQFPACNTRFPKGASWYKVEALGVEAEGTYTDEASPPPPPGEPDPVGIAGNWNLVFRDEFDASLNLNVWTKCHFWSDELDCQNVSTGELMCYQAGNVYVSGGNLVMKAEKRSVVCDGHNLSYVSGMAQTGGTGSGKAPGFNFQYGYAEARMQMPVGQGFWPGFWTAPQDFNWPPEIDIVEFNGRSPSNSYHTYHWADAAGVHQQRGFTYTGPNFTSGYHVFGIDWSPGLLVWYVDGVEVTRFASSFVPSELMYLYLNLAVGGAVGSPDAATVFPSYCLVDYVRVWKRV